MHVFDQLTPDLMLNAVEAQGFRPTGAMHPLNSYENRVYEIALDEAAPIIVKFYRPGRWSGETIAEEHRFVTAASDLEIPAVPPLVLPKPTTFGPALAEYAGYFLAIFPKFRGREQAEHTTETLRWLGHTLARLHNLGESFTTCHRLHLTPQTYGHDQLPMILGMSCIPDAQRGPLGVFLSQAVQLTEPIFAQGWQTFPVHGDCHHGNLLWNHEGPHLLDFDDMVVASPVQDVWMLFTGTAEEQRGQQEAFLGGYETFRPFDRRSFALIEPLRTLRIIRYAAWLAERYDEPAFQRAFPYFDQPRYWEELTQQLREQVSLLQELSWKEC